MIQLPRELYTKCSKSDLERRIHTIPDSGLVKKRFYADRQDARLHLSLSASEVVIKVAIEGFANAETIFTLIEPGVWENCSPILMRDVSEISAKGEGA